LSPQFTTPDFVGYENLIAFLEEREVHRLQGDLVEIGAFMGGGTVKLAEYARKYGRRVHVIDTFEPERDQTLSRGGETACSVYEAFLEGRSMLDVYQETIRGFDNIITRKQDSRTVAFGPEERFIFGFIDGCHQESYVTSDFGLIWPRLVPGGVLGFHDYEYDDWPEVTVAVRKLLSRYEDEIDGLVEITGVYDVKSLLVVRK